MFWFGFHLEAVQEPHWTLQLRRRLVRCHASKVALVLIVNRINGRRESYSVSAQRSHLAESASISEDRVHAIDRAHHAQRF